MTDASGALTAPHVLEYPYTRSVGPVLGRFFAALRERRIAASLVVAILLRISMSSSSLLALLAARPSAAMWPLC